MRRTICKVLMVAFIAVSPGSPVWGLDKADYEEKTQADLVQARDAYAGRKVAVSGVFLFTGSDFCYQIRKTKIQTKDYFCFALGTPSLVRLYLRKDHPKADTLLNLKKGAQVVAYGTFDSQGADFNYLVVDDFVVEPGG